MKNTVLFLMALCLSAPLFGQKPGPRFEISGGYGLQEYNGDLGNRFFQTKPSSYGVASLNAAYILSSSIDLGLSSNVGDMGLCQRPEDFTKEIPKEDRCVGCGEDRVSLGNLNSRMATLGFFARYKFANGYILPANFPLRPYLYAGASANRITDRMQMGCVKPGMYFSINSGVGMQVDVAKNFFLGWNTGLGMFTTDDLDLISDYDHKKDLHMEHSFLIGFRL